MNNEQLAIINKNYMNLFNEIKTCSYCKTVSKPKNSVLFNGFKDTATGQLVCWNCKPLHDAKKKLKN